MKLAKGVQRRSGEEVANTPEDDAYETGCARMVGCASAETFDMLVALPKDVMYAASLTNTGPCLPLRLFAERWQLLCCLLKACY